eukprot:3801533-Lingulodinium_polyedra.AAC.1
MGLQLEVVLRDLGIAAVVTPQQFTEVLARAGFQLAPVPQVCSPNPNCRACGFPVAARRADSVAASVLDVGGWLKLAHMPRRCRRQGCSLQDKRVWYNFVVLDERTHEWSWDNANELKYFFLSANFGVTTAWLRQYTQRAALQHVTWAAEERVHRRAAIRVGC